MTFIAHQFNTQLTITSQAMVYMIAILTLLPTVVMLMLKRKLIRLYDIIISTSQVKRSSLSFQNQQVPDAPRIQHTPMIIHWTDEGIEEYQNLVAGHMQALSEHFSGCRSHTTTSLLIQYTNDLLVNAARATNPSSEPHNKKTHHRSFIPRCVVKAKKKLATNFKIFQNRPSFNAFRYLKDAQKGYKKAVKRFRVNKMLERDAKIDSILSSNPSSVYSLLRKLKSNKATPIQELKVDNKTCSGRAVADGFYHSMSSLKYCDIEAMEFDPSLQHHFSNYSHILKICEKGAAIPEISYDVAHSLLKRLKPTVKDFFNLTPLFFLNAGVFGVRYFQFLLNHLLSDVENATIEELNIAHGVILYKGHQRDKKCHRSYRTISTCPLLAKALDLYIRDLFLDEWDNVTASTQYQTSGSSHELASLLITEAIQFSLFVTDKPIYLLLLDAQSAFDRCLRHILMTELFVSGMKDTTLLLIDNRLKSRSTVYQWCDEVLGPSRDITGFEQGGINSGDYYKLYNNEQLKQAHASMLGVCIGSTTISAVGEADDVVLLSNDIHNIKLLARLTEQYCKEFRVKLVPRKTKLLPIYHQRHIQLVNYAKLTHEVSIGDSHLEFVDEAEHVGVMRSTSGNMINVLQRITSHKRTLAAVSSAGLTRGCRSNPAASLRIHNLYAIPVLFSGLGSLLLLKSEIKVIETHLKNTIQRLQRLHENTPRAVVYLLAGCLPAEALLHQRQLSLFTMICHKPGSLLHEHAKFILTTEKNHYSWFKQISVICSLYDLPEPLNLLHCPPQKLNFKREYKKKMSNYWHTLLLHECKDLKSLK